MGINVYPVAINLNDSAGAKLTEHAYVNNAYSLTGAGPHYFYLPTDIRAEIVGVRFWNSSAQTLAVNVEIRVGASSWIAIPTYATDRTTAEAQTATTVSILRSFLIQGTEMRVSCVVGSSTTTSCQVICTAVR